MLPGSLETPSSGLPVLPLPSMPRSKTGRKPQRSSPLAGPAVLVSDAEETSNSVFVSPSPTKSHDRISLSPPTLRPRPKSMVSDYSTLSLHQQSLTLRSRPHAPGTKQIIRPISSVLPFSATQEHFSNAHSSCSPTGGEVRNIGEHLGYRNISPLTRSDSKRVSSTTRLPTISINEKPIDVDVPQVPPSARSTSRMSGTLPRDNSWYIASAYDDTPRFSRLGLSADNVVLPVSAKEYKKCQRHRQHTPNSDGKDSSGNRRSLLMGCTLKLARSFTRSSSDHQLAQEPSSPSTPSSLSSQASTTFPGSDSPTTPESLSPHPSLSRTRTSSFTNSSSSSYTCFVPDIVTSSSRTSVKEEMIQDPASSNIAHGMVLQQDSVSGKDRSRKLLTKRRTLGSSGQLRFNPETRSIVSPVLEKDEKKLRRGGMFRRFIIRFFVPL